MYPEDPDESSSSDSSSDVDEKEANSRISELNQQLETNPYLYDAHVELITLLRKLGELDRLRVARECMSKHFPLTPELWLKWIEDESSLLSDGDNREPIYRLFKRALSDYQSVDVWLEYCQYAIGGMGSGEPAELDAVRAVLEEAVANQGLNFAKGAILFEVYREFENICLAQIQSQDDPEAFKKQLKRIDNIFRRQLNISRVDLDQTFDEYKAFLEGVGAEIAENGVPPDCTEAYEAAQAKWQAVEEHEMAISDSSDETALLPAWQSYLTWVVDHASRKGTRANATKKAANSSNDVSFTPLEVICLFERAITDLCLHASIWLQMADYLEAHVSADKQRLINTLARAVRNVPWSSEVWSRYALACEAQAWDLTQDSSSPKGDEAADLPITHLSEEFNPVVEVYENALKYGYPSANDLSALWISYCDFFLRVLRNCNNSTLKERSAKLLRTTFERAISHLSSAFPDQVDQSCSIYRYWAFVEVKFLQNKERSREIWKSLLKTGHNGSKPAFWISYLDFVKNHDEVDHLRVAGMAVNSITGDYAETVFQDARRCLAESGVDYKRLREFDAKVTARRAHLASLKEGKKDSDHPPTQQSDGLPEKAQKPAKRKADEGQKPATPAKRPKKVDVKDGVWADNDGDNPTHPKHGETIIHDPSKDDRTVFISNLPFTTTEEELKSIFDKCGELVSIRLVRDYAGKSKGFGYVEFAEQSSAAAALELDRHPITATGGGSGPIGAIGRPMFVSVCDTTRRSKSGFTYSTGEPEPKKLFVRNLDKVVTEEALRTFFGKYGQVKSVRVVTFRNGVPKGHAYVEFETEDEASRALVATDGVVFGSKAISVAISNPPTRSSNSSTHSSSGSTKAKAPFTTHASARPKAHTQLSFMPRALHRANAGALDSQPTSSSGAEAESGNAATPKSNAEFRKMFLNQ